MCSVHVYLCEYGTDAPQHGQYTVRKPQDSLSE